MPKKILTVSELAEHLNVHRITIYRLLKSGSLPAFKIGRVWRFDLDDIGNWMADSKSAEAMRVAQDGHADSEFDSHTDGRVKRSRGAGARKSRTSSTDGRDLEPKR